MHDTEPGNDGSQPVAYSYVLAVFATFTYFALVVCAFGFISLLTNTDVVSQPDAGPLVGPAATASAVLTVLLALLQGARGYEASVVRAREALIGDPVRVPLGRAITTGVVAFFAYILIGSFLYGETVGQLFSGLLFAADAILQLYAVAVGLLAVLIYLAFALILAAGGSHPARPLWPWEK
ncbi:DUF6121 family protein [Mycetocola zhadangensis]|uniref:Uncharacterized protein n=1 Tax=Mycetocola zhadangensis TaxID=1164595 RepID=A0A3L7J4Y1_9MICO|nr:DUF6121 family protein [Mycetocola zhadangensis]RLQ85385.1 hypothetical protein D9V28_00360 [Mycetocola zhadangensis]GGE82136.1 hypothetical protein GCM10011313_00710 [Mycetocola zhadangensis]